MSTLKVSTGGPTDFDGLSGNDNEQRKTIEGNIDWKKKLFNFCVSRFDEMNSTEKTLRGCKTRTSFGNLCFDVCPLAEK